MSSAVPIPKKTAEQYKNLCMLRDRMHGGTSPWLAERYGVSSRASVRRCRKTFIGLQIMVMENVKADPDGPREGCFTLDEFNKDPQKCRMEMLTALLGQLERAYPALTDDLLPTPGAEEMARLFEPDGTKNIVVTVAYAIAYCEKHPGWTWEATSGCVNCED